MNTETENVTTSDEVLEADTSDDFFAFLYPYFVNKDPTAFGAWLVFMEMTLALIGIVLNLTVLISIKEKESLSNNTVTIVLANLCFANLVSAVFVKSIAVIYHGYAVATAKWKVELAFCSVYTLTSRATWAVFPYTIVVLCWHGLANRVGMLFIKSDTDSEAGLSAVAAHGYMTSIAAVGGMGDPEDQDLHLRSMGKSVSIEETQHSAEHEQEVHHHEEDDDDEFSEGLTARQKSAIGFIWSAALAYAMMSEEILSKERDMLCSVRADLTEKLNMLSLLVAIGIPLVIGPILCPLGHILLSVVACLKDAVSSRDSHHDAAEAKSTIIECGLIFGFLLVFLIFYPTHMYVVEVYLASIKTQFAFMSFKYCFGCLHLILLPMLILIIRKDICRAAIDTYIKKSPNTENEITYEDFQKNTGIGVEVAN